MLIQNSFDLNSVQLYADSLKEGLKKIMLDQEIIFRKQVQELHRLYGMQKILTENVGLKQPDGYNFEKVCTQSWFYSSKLVRHEQSADLVEDAKSSSTAMVGSTFLNSKVFFIDRHNGAHYSIYQNPVDHLLPANRCTSNVDEEVLDLSLSIGLEGNGRKHASSTCLDPKNISCSQNIINLEESAEGILNEEANYAGGLSFAAVTTCESQISALSDQIISCRGKNNVSREIEESNSQFGNRECQLEENSPGYQKCHKALTFKKSSMQNEQCIHEAGIFDLNQVQFDDSCYSNDNIMASHSTASSSLIFGISFDNTPKATFPCISKGKESSKCSFEASDILQWDDTLNSSLINSRSNNETTDPQCHDIIESEADLIAIGNKVVSLVGSCNDLGHCMSDPENINVGSVLRLSNGEFTDPDSTNMETGPANCENCNNDESLYRCGSPSEVKNGDGHILTTSCKSSCIADNSGGIKTTQSQISSGVINLVSADQPLGTENGNELGHDSSKKVEPPEVDIGMRTVAQLLINFSLGILPSNQDSSSITQSVEVNKKEMEKPQCSDSYEQIALKLEECNADDCCVSSKPYEIEGLEKMDFGFKLKRGRRLKDFQREILPGIASLARHEIQEDINIMEAVLRSREYRKINNRMADQSSWCAPVRSRRSKRSYVRRRIF